MVHRQIGARVSGSTVTLAIEIASTQTKSAQRETEEKRGKRGGIWYNAIAPVSGVDREIQILSLVSTIDRCDIIRANR